MKNILFVTKKILILGDRVTTPLRHVIQRFSTSLVPLSRRILTCRPVGVCVGGGSWTSKTFFTAANSTPSLSARYATPEQRRRRESADIFH